MATDQECYSEVMDVFSRFIQEPAVMQQVDGAATLTHAYFFVRNQKMAGIALAKQMEGLAGMVGELQEVKKELQDV